MRDESVRRLAWFKKIHWQIVSIRIKGFNRYSNSVRGHVQNACVQSVTAYASIVLAISVVVVRLVLS